jgi:hypothetical protein
MPSTFRWALSLVPCALCLFLIAPADATVLLPADMTTIVTGSAVVVHGRVVDVTSALAEGRRSIYSVVTVAVDEALKGTPGRTVSFRIPGGQVGRYKRVVIGTPEFTPGEEVVVFLRGAPPQMPVLFGLSPGVYRVRRSDASSRQAASNFIGRVRAVAGSAR